MTRPPARTFFAGLERRDALVAAALAGLAVLAFSNTLSSSAFIRDDRYIIAGNPLLQSWSSLPKLLTTGYWEGAVGAEAPVQEFRPLLMLSYALTALLLGLRPWIFHLGNLLLHAANAALLFVLLKKRCSRDAAAGAAALFAVLPVHAEAVAYISSRSELLVCFFLLLAWLELGRDEPRTARGLAFFSCALLCKEQAVLFPAVLAADDWILRGRSFASRERRPLYAGLAACAAAYLGARFLALSDPFHGGSDYFAGKSYLTRLLTMSEFAFAHYLLPSLTGLGLRAEFIRPSFADAAPGDFLAWLALGAWAALFLVAAGRFLRRRSARAFWVLGGLLWILPVSNLLIRLDTIGAERFLYLPSLGLCVLSARAVLRGFSRSRNAALAALALLTAWYGVATFRRNRVWSTELAYYERAVDDDPRAPGARSGLGVALLDRGRRAEAELSFLKAVELNPAYAPAYYNLGKIAYEKGDWDAAERRFKEALARGSKNVDAWLFLGLLAEKRGDLAAAEAADRRAVALQPWSSLAQFNLGRILMQRGRAEESRECFRRFLELAPDDPEAPAIRRLLSAR